MARSKTTRQRRAEAPSPPRQLLTFGGSAVFASCQVPDALRAPSFVPFLVPALSSLPFSTAFPTDLRSD